MLWNAQKNLTRFRPFYDSEFHDKMKASGYRTRDSSTLFVTYSATLTTNYSAKNC